jgi:hypothetical protein
MASTFLRRLGSIHNIELLEQDLDTTVVTWMNAMI